MSPSMSLLSSAASSSSSSGVNPTAQLYKQFMRVLDRWPADPAGRQERDLRPHLQKSMKKAFYRKKGGDIQGQEEEPVLAPTYGQYQCEQRLRASIKLIENQHVKDFPHLYTTGMFGYRLDDIRKMNTDKYFHDIGIRKVKEPMWKSVFSLFRKEKDDLMEEKNI